MSRHLDIDPCPSISGNPDMCTKKFHPKPLADLQPTDRLYLAALNAEPDPAALTVPPKAETVVHPAGRDWVNQDPTFEYIGPTEAAFDRISAPPRATVGETATLVAASLWARLCGRSRWLSCAVLIAAAVLAAIAGALKGFDNLIH